MLHSIYTLRDGKKQPHLGRIKITVRPPQVKVDRMSDAPKDETGMNNETARIEVGSGHLLAIGLAPFPRL